MQYDTANNIQRVITKQPEYSVSVMPPLTDSYKSVGVLHCDSLSLYLSDNVNVSITSSQRCVYNPISVYHKQSASL